MNVLQRAWQRLRGTPAGTARVRRFQAAQVDRLTAGWMATTQSINV